ncbi:MAG TPA: DNA/RNA non-specific endonuclease [Polyangiaceae bacterium]|jgi:endonuclease G|nr:DNA/RNA non-specific endonuclease [Polyangiaceae bacterium]
MALAYACAVRLSARPTASAPPSWKPSTPRSSPGIPEPDDRETPHTNDRRARVDRETAARSIHVALGLPHDGDDSDDTLLDESAFLVSYNARLHDPNWVAWHLEASDLGHAHRHDSFRPDDALPDDVYRVSPHDYARTSYDRGHLCPFADRNGTTESARRTFLMTNMEPQLHELNAGPWEKLEQSERAWAIEPEAALFIVAGGVFDENPTRIGHDVAVPRATYKIVVVLRRGQGAKDVTLATRTVAVEMPNEPGVGRRPWREFVTTIDRIEADTGYDFLSSIPEPVQSALEAGTARDP